MRKTIIYAIVAAVGVTGVAETTPQASAAEANRATSLDQVRAKVRSEAMTSLAAGDVQKVYHRRWHRGRYYGGRRYGYSRRYYRPRYGYYSPRYYRPRYGYYGRRYWGPRYGYYGRRHWRPRYGYYGPRYYRSRYYGNPYGGYYGGYGGYRGYGYGGSGISIGLGF